MTGDEEIDLLLAEPPADVEPAVLYLNIGYPDTPKTYSYALIRAGAKWYLTGPDSPQAVSWKSLVSWLKRKNCTIHHLRIATVTEDLL